MPNDECMTKLECLTRDIRVIRGSSVVEATRLGLALQVLRKPARFLATHAAKLRTGGNFVWRILIVRHQLPIQPGTGCDLSAYSRWAQQVVKEILRVPSRGRPLSFGNESPRELCKSG
jgi:hypothetical protein